MQSCLCIKYTSIRCVGMIKRTTYLWQISSCWEKVCIQPPAAPCPLPTGCSPHSWTALPEWRGSTGHLTAQTWPSGTRRLGSNTNKYTHLPATDPALFLTAHIQVGFRTNCKQRRKRGSTFIFRLFWDVTQLPQTLILLWIPKTGERNVTLRRFCDTKCFQHLTLFVLPLI